MDDAFENPWILYIWISMQYPWISWTTHGYARMLQPPSPTKQNMKSQQHIKTKVEHDHEIKRMELATFKVYTFVWVSSGVSHFMKLCDIVESCVDIVLDAFFWHSSFVLAFVCARWDVWGQLGGAPGSFKDMLSSVWMNLFGFDCHLFSRAKNEVECWGVLNIIFS